MQVSCLAPSVKLLHKLFCKVFCQEGKVLLRLFSEKVYDQFGLIILLHSPLPSISLLLAWRKREAITAREKCLHSGIAFIFLGAIDQLVEAAANAPHIGGKVVLFFQERDLRRSVPSRAHVVREAPFLFLSLILFI